MNDILLDLVPGDDWSAVVIVADEDGSPVNLTGQTVAAATIAYRNGTISPTVTIADAPAGKLLLTKARAATGALPYGNLSNLTIKLVSISDFQTTYIYGRVAGVHSLGSTDATVLMPGTQGLSGQKGWAPILAVQSDGARRVLAVVGWTGGEGAAPATGGYLGPGGIVSDIAQAGDIRGATGVAGTTSWTGITDKPSSFPPSAHSHAIADVTGLQGALDAKATPAYVQSQINALTTGAPGLLDTLAEIDAAIGNDPNFATTMTTALAGKSAIGHGHVIADVSGLSAALADAPARMRNYSVTAANPLVDAAPQLWGADIAAGGDTTTGSAGKFWSLKSGGALKSVLTAAGNLAIAGMLQLGGTDFAAAGAGLKAVGTQVQARLGNDSGFADFAARGLSITGTLTQTANGGTLLYDQVMPDGGGYGFRLYNQAAPWSNGPPGDANYTDDVWAFGVNMGGIGVRAVNSKQYAAWHIESKFYANSSQASPFTELHFQVIDINGGQHRPISGAFGHDGLYAGLLFSFSVTTLADYAGNQRISYDFTSSTINQIYHQYRTVYNFNTNNVAVAGQRNAGDTAFLNLPYYGADDRLILGAPFSAIANTPTTGSYPNTHIRVQSLNLPANGVLLNLVAGAITGDMSGILGSASPTGDQVLQWNNANSTSTTANAVLELRAAGVNAGDAVTRYKVLSGTTWWVGLDNSANDQFVIGTGALGTADKLVLDTSGNLAVAGWIKSASYTVAGVPSASVAGAGAQIFVSNESGGAVMAFSDGANWRRVTDRAAIT